MRFILPLATEFITPVLAAVSAVSVGSEFSGVPAPVGTVSARRRATVPGGHADTAAGRQLPPQARRRHARPSAGRRETRAPTRRNPHGRRQRLLRPGADRRSCRPLAPPCRWPF